MDIKLITFLLVSVSTYHEGSGYIGALVQIGGVAFDVLKFGFSVAEYFQNKNQGEQLDEISKLLSEVNERIDSVNTRIITTVLLHSRLERIDEAVLNIRSSLTDLEYIFRANDTKDKTRHMDLFVYRFDNHGVIKHLRFLSELLQYTIPGTSRPLVDLFSEHTRCNLTGLYEFEKFYFKLVSDGIAIELAYEYMHLTAHASLNRVYDRWRTKIQEMESIFSKQEMTCKEQFAALAEEDLKHAHDATTLWTNNNHRYPWLRNNVIFLKRYGTHQFLFMKHTGHYLFWNRSHKNKIVIFTEKQEIAPEPVALDTKELKAAITGKSDRGAARHVAHVAEVQLEERNYAIRSMLVFFDGGEFSSDGIKIDGDSKLIEAVIPNVELEYCYESGVQCNMDVLNWLDGRKVVKGNMKIMAYAVKLEKSYSKENTDVIKEVKYKTSEATSAHSIPVTTACMLLALAILS